MCIYRKERSLGDVRLYATQVTPLSTSMQDSDVFLEKPSITIQFNRQAGISTSDTNVKFKYLSPAMSVALMVNPKNTIVIPILRGLI